MSAGGHNAKPADVLRLHGDYREDRHGKRGPQLGGEPLRKPDDLPEHASWLWDEVTRTRAAWLCSSDAASLRTVCEAYHNMRRCQVLLAEDVTDKNTRCAWAAYQSAFASLGARFGLTPSDRARLGEDKPERDQRSELEELLSG